MDSKKIHRLFTRFEQGLTSDAEERMLYDAFRRGDVPHDLLPLRDMFVGLEMVRKPIPAAKPRPLIGRRLRYAAACVVACLALAAGLFLLPREKETEQMALAEKPVTVEAEEKTAEPESRVAEAATEEVLAEEAQENAAEVAEPRLKEMVAPASRPAEEICETEDGSIAEAEETDERLMAEIPKEETEEEWAKLESMGRYYGVSSVKDGLRLLMADNDIPIIYEHGEEVFNLTALQEKANPEEVNQMLLNAVSHSRNLRELEDNAEMSCTVAGVFGVKASMEFSDNLSQVKSARRQLLSSIPGNDPSDFYYDNSGDRVFRFIGIVYRSSRQITPPKKDEDENG